MAGILLDAFEVGYICQGGSFSSTALSSATTWCAYSFVPAANNTLNGVRVFQSAKTGSPAAADYICELWSNTAGSGTPNALIQAASALGGVPANGWFDFTGFSTALTAGTTYWIVLKNNNGTPASNSMTYQSMSQNAQSFPGGGNSAKTGWMKSTWNGTTWTTTAGGSSIRLAYSGGSYEGAPFNSGSSTPGTFGTSEVGFYFVAPANASMKVSAVSMFASKVGTPTGTLTFKIYVYNPTDTTLLNTYTANSTIASADVTTSSGWFTLAFSGTVEIPPRSVVRVTLSESAQADTVSNAYKLATLSIDSDANSLALMPFGGTMCQTNTSNNGASPIVWTQTTSTLTVGTLSLVNGAELGGQNAGRTLQTMLR